MLLQSIDRRSSGLDWVGEILARGGYNQIRMVLVVE